MTPRQEAVLKYIPTLEGWSTPEKCLYISDLIFDNKVRLSVEIGVFAGRGLLAMAMAHRELQQNGLVGTYATGIDAWQASACLEGEGHSSEDNQWWNRQELLDKMFYSTHDTIVKHHLEHWTEILRQRSDEACSLFVPKSIGVLHQDSNHSEKISCEEVARWAPLMADGGFWILDDTNDARQDRAQKMLLDYGFVEVKDEKLWKAYRLRAGK